MAKAGVPAAQDHQKTLLGNQSQWVTVFLIFLRGESNQSEIDRCAALKENYEFSLLFSGDTGQPHFLNWLPSGHPSSRYNCPSLAVLDDPGLSSPPSTVGLPLNGIVIFCNRATGCLGPCLVSSALIITERNKDGG